MSQQESAYELLTPAENNTGPQPLPEIFIHDDDLLESMKNNSSIISAHGDQPPSGDLNYINTRHASRVIQEIIELPHHEEEVPSPKTAAIKTYSEVAQELQSLMRESGSIEALQSLAEIYSEDYTQTESNFNNVAIKGMSQTDALAQTMTKLKFANIKPEKLPKPPVSRGFPKGKILKAGNNQTISSNGLRNKILKQLNVAPWS